MIIKYQGEKTCDPVIENLVQNYGCVSPSVKPVHTHFKLFRFG